MLLGLDPSRVSWNSGATRVALHPTNAFPQNREVSIYYQVGGLRIGESYRTTVQIFEARNVTPSEAAPRVRVAFTEEAGATKLEITPPRQVRLKTVHQ